MSGRPKKEEEKDIWGPLAGGLLLAGGAAAAGYMAYKMLKKDKPEKPIVANSNVAICSMYEPSPVSSNNLNPEEFGRRSEQEKCFICHVNQIEVKFEPCNHKRFCEDCAERTNKCPVCYSQITSIKPVYL